MYLNPAKAGFFLYKKTGPRGPVFVLQISGMNYLAVFS